MLLAVKVLLLMACCGAAQTAFNVILPNVTSNVSTALGLSVGDAAHSLVGGLSSQLVFGESFEESTSGKMSLNLVQRIQRVDLDDVRAFGLR